MKPEGFVLSTAQHLGNQREQMMSKKVFVIYESAPVKTVTRVGKRQRGWLLEISLLAISVAAVALWLAGNDEHRPEPSSEVQMQPPARSSTGLPPELAADPFGVRDWGSMHSGTERMSIERGESEVKGEPHPTLPPDLPAGSKLREATGHQR
jgi:hypothetical protein